MEQAGPRHPRYIGRAIGDRFHRSQFRALRIRFLPFTGCERAMTEKTSGYLIFGNPISSRSEIMDSILLFSVFFLITFVQLFLFPILSCLNYNPTSGYTVRSEFSVPEYSDSLLFSLKCTSLVRLSTRGRLVFLCFRTKPRPAGQRELPCQAVRKNQSKNQSRYRANPELEDLVSKPLASTLTNYLIQLFARRVRSPW